MPPTYVFVPVRVSVPLGPVLVKPALPARVALIVPLWPANATAVLLVRKPCWTVPPAKVIVPAVVWP